MPTKKTVAFAGVQPREQETAHAGCERPETGGNTMRPPSRVLLRGRASAAAATIGVCVGLSCGSTAPTTLPGAIPVGANRHARAPRYSVASPGHPGDGQGWACALNNV